MTEREEPVWTGRYGEPHLEAVANGRDYQVVSFHNSGDAGNGAKVFGPGHHIDERDGSHNWTDFVVIRAYNAEDAFRNAGGALGQWNVWFNEFPGLDWETAPFTDKDGNFASEGGDHGEGFDAYPPDETARDGIVRSDIFSEEVSFVPETVVLERSVAQAPKI